jgi:predicted ATP-dependent endonuclease of OLD family
MKIEQFEIKSYKSCVKTSVPFHSRLTALIGINGAGKSNIMTSIYLLKKLFSRQGYAARAIDESANKCSIKLKFNNEKQDHTFNIFGKYVTDDRNIDDIKLDKFFWINPEDSSKVEIPSILFNETYTTTQLANYLDFLSKHNPNDSIQISRTVLRKIHPIIVEVVKFCKGISYYSASHFSDPSKSPVYLELEDNKPVRRYLSNVHTQFITDLFFSSENEPTKFENYINTVNANGLGLVEEISFEKYAMPSSSFEVKSAGKIKEIKKDRVLIVPSFRVYNKNLSANQLSEGTFKTLALVYYILTVNSKLLLIEEPEMCIHHGLLNSVMALIKMQSKHKQIIVSTHSDYVLDQLSPENIILVKYETAKGTVAKQLTKHLKKNEYEALKRYLLESGNLGEYWKEGGIDE